MNKEYVSRLLAIVTDDNNGFLCFEKEFLDNSTWTAAYSHNIATKAYDYNDKVDWFYKQFPNEDKFEMDENNVVTKVSENVPLIRCKDFTVVQVGDKLHREDKFVGKVLCKFDEDYRQIHVWFSTKDNDEHYHYLGCISKYSLEKHSGIEVVLKYAEEDPVKGDY